MNGTCICQPDCGGKDCGDDGCGWNCGSCNGNFICTNGKCTCPPGDCGPEINWVEGEPYPVADNKIAPSVIAVDGTDIHLFGGTKWARHVVFNATSGTWTIKELLPFHISDGAAGTVNGVIYACGDGSFGAVEMYRYEEGADTWTKLAGNPYPRRLPGYAVVDGKIYLAGGFAGSYNMKTNVYNPSNDSWSALADIKPPNGTGVLYGAAFNSKFYIFGGNDDQSDVYMFTPGNNSWTQQQSIPKDRYMGMAVTVGDEILLLGGRQSNTAKDSVYVFDPAANNWSESEPLPAAVYGGQAAYVNGKIYIFSGSNGIGNYSDKTWIGTVQ